MKKQFILAGTGILLVIAIFILGRTTTPKKNTPKKAMATMPVASFNIDEFINTERKKLTPSQASYLKSLENKLAANNSADLLTIYNNLANFWKDSAHVFEPYAFWISKAAKLDNSEKNLTFAAQLFLNRLRGEHDDIKLNWETKEAISLYEQALVINPENDDLRIGLGSCYVFGSGRNGNPTETMKGIQQLLSVVRKDSTNMKAQLVLGVGGYVSGQYDKAIDRLQKVVSAQPENIEAIAFLADAYAAKGDKESAIKWYNVSKRMINNPRYSQEVDERIRLMK